VHGWALWTPRKGIMALRNPIDREKRIRIRLQDAFELPPGAAQVYSAKSQWNDDASQPAILLRPQPAHEFQLAPFEVLPLDITPQ